MKPSRITSFLWLAATCLLTSLAVRAQQPITITNPGFELPAVVEEVYNQTPSGWSSLNGAALGSEAYVYNPTTIDFPTEAPQGFNVAAVAFVSGEKGFSQTLATIFQAGDSYQLIVKVGNTAAVSQFPGYRVQLVVNNTVLAEDNNTQPIGEGQFVTSTVNYAYDPAQDALLGQPLQIRLLSKGLVTNSEVAFDDVKLFAVLANPLASAGGPYFLPNPAATLSLNASASLPSGTATITQYDWDLNNDGQFGDVTGVTPAAISFATLRSVYGMVDGSNTIRIRVTDSAAKTAIAQGTVELVTSTKYNGINGSNSDTWNVATNWSNGIPGGDLDVVVLSSKAPMAWSDATSAYKGNLTLQNNARLTIGWTTQFLGSYNALGTPGLTKIIMNPGTSITTRMGGSPVIPEIQLLANASFSLGESTQGGAQAQFNYPITGAFQLQLLGNNQGSCIANLNASNGFATLLASGSESGLTIRANAFGSLGTGDVTLAQRDSNTTCYAILEINAANAMADTGTLRISGTGATLLRMNANDTIAGLILDGVQQPLGTYGSLSSTATNKRSWITGTGILTLATPTVGYWDLNGTTVGAGGTSPSGTWNNSNAFWNANTAGTGSVSAWTPGNTPIFSAGSDATGTYAVDVVGSNDIGGMIIRNGSVAFTQGASGALRLTSDSNINVVTGSTSIATPITESSARALSKSGSGTLTLSNSLSHTGGTSIISGNLTLSGNNIAATGSTTVTNGILRVDSSSDIPGTARNLTINATGKLIFGPSFGSGNIQTALNSRVVASSAGTIAADNNAAANFDFNAAGLTAAYFGSLSNVSYTGTLTPQGTAYRLNGEGGTITMANANALTNARSLTARGNVALAVGNNYSGATTVETNASLSLLGSTGTSGITLNSGSTLTLGDNGSLGIGALTISGTSTLNAIGTVVTTNAVAANADFVITGAGALTLGNTTINNNRTITNTSSSTATFSSITRDGSNNRNLTITGSGNTTVTGSLTLGTGTLTKNGTGTLTLQGSNAYAATTIEGGILRLNGSVSGAGATTINAGTLQLGSTSNGGVSSGDITINNTAAFIQAANADRSISNNIILNNNGTTSGNFSLTVGGTLTNFGGNRTITNNITSGKSLNLGAVNLSNDATNRTLTIAGSGTTVVNGAISNGSGSTAGSLIKSGTGSLILNGASTYAGSTTVNAGKLFVNGSTGANTVSVSANATLGGTGTIGGNTTIAANGRLEFDIKTTPGTYDKLELSTGRSLTFFGASVVTITGTPTVGTYTLLTAPGGIIGSLPTLSVPNGWDVSLSIVGNDLRLNVTFTGVFPPDPTVVSIQDDQGGGPVYTNTTVTYTVTFSEDMNAATVTSVDFDNAGSSAISFGTITETSPGVFTIQVTPTTQGTLLFRVKAGTTLTSTAGQNVNTLSAILDNDTLQVQTPAAGVLTVSFGDFVSSGTRGGPFSPASKQYTLTNNGVASITWTAAKTASWLDLSSTGGTLAAGANTTVTASINASANSLAIAAYYDSLTFTNTTNGVGNATRGVGLTVNGLPAQVTLANLNQTYDGTPKPVSVTTNPPALTNSITYNGLATVPTNAGSYDIVATVTDPNYAGSANDVLVIAKAAQTINFAALSPIGNDQTTLALTATASSGLPVSYSSSNTSVATVSGSTLTIVGVGTTTITASQAGNDNYEAAANVQRTLDVILTNPLAVPGGPYTVTSSVNLALNGSLSLPSSNQTITAFEWDLNVNDNGGIFNVNVTGATPTPTITLAVLQSTYGMVNGNNTIRLRVKDSANKTSAPVSTTVTLFAPLLWDANGATAGQTDGGGAWLNASQWWTGTTNVSWLPDNVGKDVRFGNGLAGGTVSLVAPTSIGSLLFNTFTGTYTLGTAAQALTINGGIASNASTGIVTFPSPIVLGAAQTWTNNSSGALTLSSTLDNGSFTLTIDNTGLVDLRGVISGSGGIIKNGTGRLQFSTGTDNTYTGPTVINGGVLMYGTSASSLGSGNITLNGGVFEAYWSSNMTRTLGTAPGQIRLIGGASGFSLNGSTGASVIINNSASFEVAWGSEHFSPSVLVLQSPSAQNGSSLNFQNRIDLNGQTRTVQTAMTTGNATGSATISGIIRNSSVTPAGLIKTGNGRLNLNAANTYNGGTILQEGTLQLGNVSGLGASVGSLTVNAGLLNLNNMAAVTVGNPTGAGGTIANNGAAAITFTIGNGGGTGGNFQGVIADNTNAGTGTLALTKTGTGSITLSGTNTYTGATAINQGKLFINGSTAGGNVSVANGATLGGNGTLGGNTTMAAGAKLEFNLSTPAGSHNPLDIASGKTLAFSGASELTITLAFGAAPGTYVLVTGGNNITGIAPATLNLPAGCLASVSIVGNELRLQVTSVGDIAPPTLLGIVDNQGGGPILLDTLVTYTVTFNEDINAATVSSADFANAGTAAINLGTITETSPGIFTVQVTPTTAGTLRLRIPVTAVIQDNAGNALVTNPALDDDTIITVNAPPSNPYVAWSGGAAFTADANADGVSNGMAWLLGASGTSANSLTRLPVASQSSGNLTLTFTCLKVANRGGAVLKLQYSRDMGITHSWQDAAVPDTSSTVNSVTFIASANADPNLINIQATIPASVASPGTKIFARLNGVSAP